MKVKIQCIHCKVDEQFQKRLKEKLLRIGAKYDWIKEGFAYLKIEKNSQSRNKVVELFLHIMGSDIYVKTQEETFDLAVKKAIESIRRQLKKHKGRDFAHLATNPLKI